MPTSQHWPGGARFLTDLGAFLDEIHALPPCPEGHSINAIARFEVRTQDGQTPTPISAVSISHSLRSISAHHALALAQEARRLTAQGQAFLQEALALDALRAHARTPFISATIYAQHRHIGTGRGKIMLEGPNTSQQGRQDKNGNMEHVGFGGATPERTFAHGAQRLLDGVDALCTYPPNPQDPTWHAFTLPAPDNGTSGAQFRRKKSICPPFQAPSRDAARVLAPILAWDWTWARSTLFETATPA